MKPGFVFFIFLLISTHFVSAAPPFSGTIFLDPDIIVPSDPTTYVRLEDTGQGDRLMFDRRSGWVTLNAFLFQARYLDGDTIEFQVNPEFETVEAARTEALRFAPVIGQLPKALRRDVATVWIHKGINPFGGGNNNLLIHVGQADDYMEDGILEETLVHEASHTSLDGDHANAAGWLAAQEADAEFITTYARDNASREDIAETFLVWLALRHRADRISESLRTTIENTTPKRLAYFDQQDFDLFPIVIPEKPPELITYSYDASTLAFMLSWASRLGSNYVLESSKNLKDWEILKQEIPSQGAETEVVETLTEPSDRIFLRIREVLEE